MPKKEVKTKLSRAEMEQIIRGGGSIHHGGEIITSIAGLPDDVDLADSPEDLEAAVTALEAEEDALFQKRRRLEKRFRAAERGTETKAGARTQEDPPPDLESMKVEELKKLAEERGVDLTGLTKKAEIIHALNSVAE